MELFTKHGMLEKTRSLPVAQGVAGIILDRRVVVEIANWPAKPIKLSNPVVVAQYISTARCPKSAGHI